MVPGRQGSVGGARKGPRVGRVQAMSAAILALGPGDAPGLAVRMLAVLGGALIGGLFVGFLAKLFTRLLTTRPMPLWGVRLMRLLGAVAGGWLVALFVAGGGMGG